MREYITPADDLRFSTALARTLGEERLSEGFTVLKEGYVHKTVKLYYEPDERRHEVPLLGSVADIFDGERITEVQTGSFAPLLPKIKKLIREYPVRLVHPFPIYTSHRWLDKESGEISAPARRGTERSIYSAARELYSIRELLSLRGFSFTALLYEREEFRALDGRGRDKKRGATLLGRIPTRIVGEITFEGLSDYERFIPGNLGESFTRAEYLRAIKSRSRYDGVILKLLVYLGFVEETGKRGRAILYARKARNRQEIQQMFT